MSKSLVIIGGGLGGLSLALIAAKKNWKVKIIEKNSSLGGKLNQKKINDLMTIQEKIEKAEERIKELKVLILHWRNSTDNVNYMELGPLEQKRSIKDELQAA